VSEGGSDVTNVEGASKTVHDDVSRIIHLALDINYYRSVDDDGGLGAAAWLELRDAVGELPEAER